MVKNEIDAEIEEPAEEEKEKLGWLAKTKARIQAYKEKKADLEAEFFTYEDGDLDSFDPDKDENKKKSALQLFKMYMIKLLTVALILYILWQYLETLGKEES